MRNEGFLGVGFHLVVKNSIRIGKRLLPIFSANPSIGFQLFWSPISFTDFRIFYDGKIFTEVIEIVSFDNTFGVS